MNTTQPKPYVRDGMILDLRLTKSLTRADRKQHGTNSTGRITVKAGLWHPGNGAQQRPHFSVTGEIGQTTFGNYSVGSGGCIHDEILRYFPKLASVVALHLSDDTGMPSYAEANGWYNLAGALGGLGEEYHVGNSMRNFRIVPPADQPWRNTEYRSPTPDECLGFWADHVRIPHDEARRLVELFVQPFTIERARQLANPGATELAEREEIRIQTRTSFFRWVTSQEPRWKAEADEAIKLLLSLGAVDHRPV